MLSRRSRASARRRTNGSRSARQQHLGDGAARRRRAVDARAAGRRTRRRRGGRRCRRSRSVRLAAGSATSWSSTSPRWWPSVSLTSLKWSRSMIITARAAVAALGGAQRLLDAVAEQHAVRQAGERVVQRLVLLGDRLAAAAVDGEQRQEEQRQRRQREVGGEHDDRREAEQQAGGRGLEEEVATRGSARSRCCSASAIAPATKLELSARKTSAAATMPGRSSGAMPVGSVRRGRSLSACSTTPAAATVIAYCAALKAMLLRRLAADPVGEDRAEREGDGGRRRRRSRSAARTRRWSRR